MPKIKELSDDLLRFIDASKSVYHATAQITDRLEAAGFICLDEKSSWNLESGNDYYIIRNSSAVVAFKMGSQPFIDAGFHIAGAHTDSPGLKLKADSFIQKHGYATVTTEVYGGPIVSTWLDRSLTIAGKVMLNDNNTLVEKLINFEHPIATIPNLAIHLNRDVNDGFKYNKQDHLSVIIDAPLAEKVSSLTELLANHLNVDKNQIMEADLFLTDTQPPHYTGINQQLISSPKIDNLAMCHSILTSLIESAPCKGTSIGVFYDNEEVGSQTLQGAASSFFKDILERIVLCSGGSKEDFYRTTASSFQISADGAHAIHPNFTDKHDKAYAPQINKGPVIKLNANYRYATTSESASRFIQLCQAVDVPYQKMANRSDMPSGSTIGPISSAATGIQTVDVGNPMLAMHSIREVSGVFDHYLMTKILKEFFND